MVQDDVSDAIFAWDGVLGSLKSCVELVRGEISFGALRMPLKIPARVTLLLPSIFTGGGLGSLESSWL